MAELLENVSERYIKSSTEGRISITDKLNILEYLVERFKLKTISQYAKENGLSYPGAAKRVESNSIMSIMLGDIVFIIPS